MNKIAITISLMTVIAFSSAAFANPEVTAADQAIPKVADRVVKRKAKKTHYAADALAADPVVMKAKKDAADAKTTSDNWNKYLAQQNTYGSSSGKQTDFEMNTKDGASCNPNTCCSSRKNSHDLYKIQAKAKLTATTATDPKLVEATRNLGLANDADVIACKAYLTILGQDRMPGYNFYHCNDYNECPTLVVPGH